MSKNLAWALAVTLVFGLTHPFDDAAIAQSDCGSAGCSAIGQVDGYFEGQTSANVFDGCDRGCPQEPGCPAACCGNYISIFGGLTTFDAFEVDAVTAATVVEERSLDADEGYGWGFAIGQQYHPRMRAELEFSYRENDFDAFGLIETTTTGGVPSITNTEVEVATGDFESYGVMANVYFDFAPRVLDRFTLYGGGGVGALIANGTATTATRVLDVNDSTFAYQIIAGANKSVTQRVDLFVDYRYMSANSLNVSELVAAENLGGFRHDTNNLMFGLRLRW